jgi:ElaB/YqjD/DUF883 family membrane-anchored ribosome-binding protein
MQSNNAVSEAVTNGQDAMPPVIDKMLVGATREVNNLLADIEDLFKSMTSLTGADLARARAQLEARLAAAKESAQKIGGAIAERARDGANAADGYVHAQPWTAIGIGAALGLVIGIAIARR